MTAYSTSSGPRADEREVNVSAATTSVATAGMRRRPPASRRPAVRARRRHRASADRPAAPAVTVRHHMDLGPVRLSLLSPPAPPAAVKVEGRSAWHLVFAPGGPLLLGGARRLVQLEAGSVTLYEPCELLRLSAARDQARALVLHLPEAALPLPGEALRQASGRPVPTGTGPAALLASYVNELAAHVPSAEACHAAWLGTAAANLATAFLAAETASPQPSPEPRPPSAPRPAPSATDVLLRDIKTYIEHHLHDPDLSPAAIAAANHISLRYLHHLFQRDDRTVGAFLRERRLDHCRADLADPAHAHRSVCDIARRWGFRDPAVFNRTFKSAYGLTPGAYRQTSAASRQ